MFVSLFLARQPPVSQSLLIHEISRSHTQRRTTVGRTPLDEWSAHRRDFYLITHNTHNRDTPMPPGGIRTHNPSRRTAAVLRLRPRGHWDRLSKNIKCSRYRPGVAQRVERGIALLFHDSGTRRGVWSAARPGRTLPPGKIGTHFTGGWVGPRVGLDGRKI